ncbi:mmachc, partial [Symbiodinium pilosum]
KSLPAELDAEIVNTDEGPPYYHVQTIGAVCAEDEHIEAKDVDGEGRDDWQEELSDRLEETRDPKMWGTESEMLRKIFGVNVHPVWGGWYAYRALIVLRKGTQASLQQPEPLTFLMLEDKKRILSEYNLRHQLCLWRDINDSHVPERRYSPEEYFFFTETSPDKRRRFLEMKASQMAAVPRPRWEAR